MAQVFRRTSDHLRILTFRSPDDRRQVLKTTNKHPFWAVNRQQFINAGDLEPGDTVTGPNGELQHLLTTQYEHHPDGIPVFNFEVTDYHTYYVAENGARATPLLVHNAEGYAPDRRAILREAEQLDELSRLNARSSITLDHYQDEMIDLIELTDRLDRNSLLLPEVEEQLRRANAAQEAFEASMDAYDEAYFSSGHLLNQT